MANKKNRKEEILTSVELRTRGITGRRQRAPPGETDFTLGEYTLLLSTNALLTDLERKTVKIEGSMEPVQRTLEELTEGVKTVE